MLAHDHCGRVRRELLVLVSGLLLFTGCLPYSCQRQPNETLFSADSTSRQVAETAPVDSLEQIHESTGTKAHSLAYPRTVRFVTEGEIAVSDAKRNSLFEFAPDGSFRREIVDEAFDVPYLMGHRADTLVVFNAGADRIDFVSRGQRLAGRSISYDRPTPEALVYMLATDESLYAKVVGQETGSQVVRLNQTGGVEARAELGGPYWRRAGFLRSWGDSLLSLSGYRPVVHRLPSRFGDGATPDSLLLVGFDSPMLERSYAYAAGDVDKPPLLSASGAAIGDSLFVLNLRPGWVQIDLYNRNGRLQRQLVEPHSGGSRDFYPHDLDVRRVRGGYRFAVAVRSPTPALEIFEWYPEGR